MKIDLNKLVEKLVAARERGDDIKADALYVGFGRFTGSDHLLIDPDDALLNAATESEATRDYVVAGLLDDDDGEAGPPAP